MMGLNPLNVHFAANALLGSQPRLAMKGYIAERSHLNAESVQSDFEQPPDSEAIKKKIAKHRMSPSIIQNGAGNA